MTLRLDAKLAATIERLAREAGKTKSEILRDAVDRYQRNRRRPKGETTYDRVKHLIGSCHSGRGDLSVDTGRKFTEMLLEEKRASDADRRRSARRAG